MDKVSGCRNIIRTKVRYYIEDIGKSKKDMMGCLIAVKCTVECRLKRSAICYAIGEGGAGV